VAHRVQRGLDHADVGMLELGEQDRNREGAVSAAGQGAEDGDLLARMEGDVGQLDQSGDGDEGGVTMVRGALGGEGVQGVLLGVGGGGVEPGGAGLVGGGRKSCRRPRRQRHNPRSQLTFGAVHEYDEPQRAWAKSGITW